MGFPLHEGHEYFDCAMQAIGPEPLFSILGHPITNTILATLLGDAVIIALIAAVRRRMSLVPGRLQGAVEALVDYLHTTTKQVAGDRVSMIFPWVAVFFIYIALQNLLGLLPGFGTIGFYRAAEAGTSARFIPLLHAGTSDLNQTLALAVISVVASHVLSIRANGFKGYITRFVALNPLFLFVGLIELASELTKFLSFSFRLYGNISAGELVLGSIGSLAAFVVPVPFLALEILVAAVQAMIFSFLTMAFMTILTEPHTKGGLAQ